MPFLMDPSPRIVRIYEDLQRAGEAAGFAAKVGWYGYNNGISFRIGAGVDAIPLIWAGRRDWGTLVCLGLPHGLYRLADPARLGEACVAIMGRARDASVPLWYGPDSYAYTKAAMAGAVPRWFDADFEREFGLVPLNGHEWRELELEERERRFAQTGWRQIPEDEDDALHDRILKVFHPGRMHLQQIRVPDGARGFDIDAAYAGGEATQRLGADLAFRILDALRKATRPGERLYAKELPSCFWSFDPHADITEAELDSLPVSFLPDVDRNYVLAPDFRFGLLGRCPEPRMYVFGDELIAAFGDDWPEAFTALS